MSTNLLIKEYQVSPALSTNKGGKRMSNFESRVHQPWTTYDNRLIQEKSVFKNANQKLCYLYLVSYANANKIFPSMPSIANAICSTTRTAMTVIQQLEDYGFIEVIRTSGKANNYILHDYFHIVSTSEKFSPVQNLHQSSEKFSPVPVKNFHPKTTNKKELTKKKNSSSSEARLEIENKLKEKFPQVPFEEIKEALVNDPTAVIKTNKQFEKMLLFRLENYVPKKPKAKKTSTKKKPTRTEMLPEWYHEALQESLDKKEEQTPEQIEQRMIDLQKRLDKYKKQG